MTELENWRGAANRSISTTFPVSLFLIFLPASIVSPLVRSSNVKELRIKSPSFDAELLFNEHLSYIQFFSFIPPPLPESIIRVLGAKDRFVGLNNAFLLVIY